MFKVKNDFTELSMDYIYIDKYQDQLLLDYKNIFWGSKASYNLINNRIKNSILQVDSILINEKYTKGLIYDNLINLKLVLNSYKQTIENVYQLNEEIYEPTIGIESKNNFLLQRTYSEKHFQIIGLKIYFDKLVESGQRLNKNEISKKEFQKISNNILKEISEIKVAEQNKYFFLLFQDHFADYYNNTLLQYTKLRKIGLNYNEGIMKSIDVRNKEIYSIIDFLNSYVDKKIRQNHSINLIDYLIIFLVINAFVFIILLIIYKILYTPWKKMEPFLEKFAKGEIHEMDENVIVSELKLISSTFNRHIKNLDKKRVLIEELTKKNYSEEFKPEKSDSLGMVLINLRNELLKSEKESIKFRQTEEHQKWAANGIAKIGAVMRQYTNDIELLSKNTLIEILQYIDGVQGALYLYDSKDDCLNLTTYYSYGKQRIKQHMIKPFEGIIGTVLVEKKEYYFANIPDDYTFIETGLGRTKPKSLFIFPLLFENNIYGIIELASLDDFPEYKREFILSLANEIAITISYTQINVQTNMLLKQSEIQAKDLKSNEKLYKKNQENLKSLLRMTEQKLVEKEEELLYKEDMFRQKITDLLNIEKELSDKEEYIESIINEYENNKSSLENQNEDLRKRIEDLEKRLREKED